ncbi:MAG TPA: DUF1080 domain-containing protein [Nitrososphaeraceae archaeon]
MITYTIILIVIITVLLPLGLHDLESTSVINQSNTNNISITGYASIFDGKTFDGWVMLGSGRFIITDDGSLQSAGHGILWYTKTKYENFVLELKWKVAKKDDNSGVFVRFPDPHDDPKIPVKHGYEIQIDDAAENPLHQTGAIYDFAGPTKMVSNPPSQWNKMQIQVINQSYTIFINEEKINEFVGNRQAAGYIGLQAHNEKSVVLFKDIMIKELK